MLEQFPPRFNRPFQVPPQYPEPVFRPLNPELCLEQVLCFKHRRKVSKDNTVRFQLHTLQLLPGLERPSYAGAAVEVLKALDGRLSVRHEGRIVAAQEAPPSPVFLRNGHGRSATVPVPPSGAHGLGKRWTATLDQLDSRAEDTKDQGPSLTARPPPASPKSPPRASRRSFRGRGGKRFRNPGARECRFERSSGSWESTGPPCNFSSYPTGVCTIILKQRRLGVSGRGRPEWMPWEQPGRAWGRYEFGVVVSTSTQRVTHLQRWPTI